MRVSLVKISYRWSLEVPPICRHFMVINHKSSFIFFPPQMLVIVTTWHDGSNHRKYRHRSTKEEHSVASNVRKKPFFYLALAFVNDTSRTKLTFSSVVFTRKTVKRVESCSSSSCCLLFLLSDYREYPTQWTKKRQSDYKLSYAQ